MSHAGNLVVILAAAVAAWVFGGIYYTLLSRPWLAAQGKTQEQAMAEHNAKSGIGKIVPFILVFIGEWIMAWAMYGIILHMNMFTLRAGLITGAGCWLGFVLTTITANNAFQGRKAMLTVIDSIGWLGAMLIIGGIIGRFGP